MPDADGQTPAVADSVAASARRKVALRILPLLLAMYIVSYLDRANLSFAKLQMKTSLGFSEEVLGWGIGLFFAGYLLLEIPGALLVEHWSARKWFARILVTWGLCSMATALVTTPGEFYTVRVLLGLAEAGFFPGVIVYFTHWFPRQERARAMSMMLMAVPVSLLLGSGVSAVLLKLDWLGLAGWQWVFLIEGAPAVLLGLAVPFLMTDRPHQARWLSPEERESLGRTLAAEKRADSVEAVTVRQALRSPTVWLLALAIMATNIGGYGVVFWLPTAVKGLLTTTGEVADDTTVLLWTAPIYLCGMAAVLVSGRLTDRTGLPKWNCIAGQVGAFVFLAGSAIPGQPWAAVFAWLLGAGFWIYYWITPFWVLPTLALTSSAAAVAVGVINVCANLAGLIGSPIVGTMKDRGWTDADCLLFLAGNYLLGAVLLSLVRIGRQAREVKR